MTEQKELKITFPSAVETVAVQEVVLAGAGEERGATMSLSGKPGEVAKAAKGLFKQAFEKPVTDVNRAIAEKQQLITTIEAGYAGSMIVPPKLANERIALASLKNQKEELEVGIETRKSVAGPIVTFIEHLAGIWTLPSGKPKKERELQTVDLAVEDIQGYLEKATAAMRQPEGRRRDQAIAGLNTEKTEATEAISDLALPDGRAKELITFVVENWVSTADKKGLLEIRGMLADYFDKRRKSGDKPTKEQQRELFKSRKAVSEAIAATSPGGLSLDEVSGIVDTFVEGATESDEGRQKTALASLRAEVATKPLLLSLLEMVDNQAFGDTEAMEKWGKKVRKSRVMELAKLGIDLKTAVVFGLLSDDPALPKEIRDLMGAERGLLLNILGKKYIGELRPTGGVSRVGADVIPPETTVPVAETPVVGETGLPVRRGGERRVSDVLDALSKI